MTKKLTVKQNRLLTEIYRRLFYFHDGDINEPLLLLSTNYQARPLTSIGLIEPSKNISIGNQWFKLTTKGKELFNSCKGKNIEIGFNNRVFGYMNEHINLAIFEEKVTINFNKLLQ